MLSYRLSETSCGFYNFRGVLKVDTCLSIVVALKVFLRPVASASPVNLLGMQILRPSLDPLNQSLWGWGLTNPPDDSAAN